MITHNYANTTNKGDNEAISIPSFLRNFQLPTKSLDERKATIGGSDICILAGGDEEKQTKLYHLKSGTLQPEDLSTVWAVMAGCATEDLNLAWFVGFASVEKPEVAIATLVEGVIPQDQVQGGLTATPIARDLLQAYFDKINNKLALGKN